MARPSSTAVSPAPGPVRVLVAELGEPVPDLGSARDAGGRYDTAQIFATRGGRLVGEIEVDVPVSGTELASRLRTAFAAAPAFDDIPPTVPDDQLPSVTVVVATTMERVTELERCLASLLRLDYPAFDVVVVDNRPAATAERAQLHARLARDDRVSVVTEHRPGISAARNHGARTARGQIVAFTDDDAVAHRGWLRAVANRFVNAPDTDCVTGPVLPAELETPAQIWFERSGSKLASRFATVSFQSERPRRGLALTRSAFEVEVRLGGTTTERALVYRAGTFGMGANLAFRRSALAALGGFDLALGTGTPAGGGEDILALARLLRAGGRVTFDPGVIMQHYHRTDYESSKRQMYYYGLGATAALTALAVSDLRHCVGLLYVLAPALRVVSRKSATRKSTGYPAELSALETRGLLVGPLAYLRSRLTRPRRRRADRDWGVPAARPARQVA